MLQGEGVTERTYLEGFPEFVRHDIVEERVHGGWQIIEYPRHVCKDGVHDNQDVLRFARSALSVHSQQSLSVKRRPADEEGDHHCDCTNEDKIQLDRGEEVGREAAKRNEFILLFDLPR